MPPRAPHRPAPSCRALCSGGLLVPLATLCAPTAGAQGAGPSGAEARAGFEYVFQVSQETVDERGRVRREPAFVARARSLGHLVRVDFLPGSEGRNTPGDWYLTGDGGRSMTFVDERARTHHRLDVAAVREQVREEKGLEISVADLATRVLPEGPCGTVSGVPTTCAAVHWRYTVRTRFWVMRTETQVEERVRYWMAPTLPDFAPPFASFFGSRTDLLVRRDSGFVAREREVARGLGPGGVLRVEIEQTETTGRARVRRTRVIETYRVRRAVHDERLFEVPAGYRLVRR